ncbi:hypothetical protein Tco_1473118, partial [Tanacetum coccineum]
MTKMMTEKNKEDDVGACFEKLEIPEEDVSKLTRMVMEKNKEDDTLEEDVSKMKKMMMEKNKDDDVRACFEKLKILKEDVSKLMRMMMEKNKEYEIGACIENADYKKLWLLLKTKSCGKWVKNAGKSVLSR